MVRLFSTKVEQTSPGSLTARVEMDRAPALLRAAPANAVPAEQADGAGTAAGSTEAAAGAAGTDGVSSAATDQNAAQAADDSAQADAEAAAQPSLQQRKQPDRHQPIRRFLQIQGAPSGYHMD